MIAHPAITSELNPEASSFGVVSVKKKTAQIEYAIGVASGANAKPNDKDLFGILLLSGMTFEPSAPWEQKFRPNYGMYYASHHGNFTT